MHVETGQGEVTREESPLVGVVFDDQRPPPATGLGERMPAQLMIEPLQRCDEPLDRFFRIDRQVLFELLLGDVQPHEPCAVGCESRGQFAGRLPQLAEFG
jgi:hypothetical protein